MIHDDTHDDAIYAQLGVPNLDITTLLYFLLCLTLMSSPS